MLGNKGKIYSILILSHIFIFMVGINFNSENQLIRSDIIVNDNIEVIRDTNGHKLSLLKSGNQYYLPISEQGLFLGYSVRIEDIVENENQRDKIKITMSTPEKAQNDPIYLDLDTEYIDGGRFTNEDIYKVNQTVLVNYASWCDDCKMFFREYKKVKDVFKEKGIQVIGVPLYDREQEELAFARIEEEMIEFDLQGEFRSIKIDKETEEKLQGNLQNIPSYTVVDNKGRIVMKEDVSDIDLQALLNRINSLEVCGEC